METLLKDIRFALRTVAGSPLLIGAALVSLALGIGANTTIFTLVNAVFLRGLPVEEPGRLVSVFTIEAKQNSQLGNFMPVSRPNFEDLRDQTGVFSELVDTTFVQADLSARGGEPEQILGQQVAGSYFRMLGVDAFRGRVFGPEVDDALGAHPVVVLSHRFWQRRFGGAIDLIGDTITLNRQPFTVIGIAPPGFEGTFALGRADFWAPMMMYETFWTGAVRKYIQERRALFMFVYGRLKPDVTMEQAKARLETVGLGLQEAFPEDNENRNFTLMPLSETTIPPAQRENFVRAGSLLMTVVGLILLIACANVANLLIGRAASRRREIAIRMSMGASRWRVVRQLLTESVLLGLLAGALGLGFAYWARAALWSMRPPFLQQSGFDLSFDARILIFTVLVSFLTGIVFGLVPALRASRPGLVDDLKESSDSERGLGRTLSLRNLLVTGQVALSCVALVGSGVFLRSLAEATRVDLGFEPGGLAMMTFDLSRQGYDEGRGGQFLDSVVERANQVPGVEAATLATIVPLTGGGFLRTVYVDGRDTEDENNGILTPANIVGPGFFKTLGIELRRGRDFTSADRSESQTVAIVNEAMAERFWPGEEVVGRRFTYHGEDEVWEVVGVVETSKYTNLGEDPQPQAYVPRLQSYNPAITLIFRTSGDSAAVLETVRAEVQSLDPALPLNNPQTLETAVGQALWAPRMAAILLGAMGGLALLLAAVGIYGVTAYTVSQRRHEIGIRMALGAEGKDVLRLILGQGLTLVAVGLGLGLITSMVAVRKIAPLLFGVSSTDAVALGGTALVLATVAVVANLIPAQRAAAVDPVVVLRRER